MLFWLCCYFSYQPDSPLDEEEMSKCDVTPLLTDIQIPDGTPEMI